MDTDPASSRPRRRPAWLRAGLPWLLPAFVLVVLGILVSRARLIDWPAVGAALAAYRADTLLLAASLALCGHLCAGSYDLIGRWYTGHRLSARKVMATNLTAYVFAHNLGALVGGWGFRLRLYLRAGLDAGCVARIIAIAVLTNWSGFILLAGLTLLLAPPSLPELGATAALPLRVIGAALLGVLLATLLLSRLAQRRGWRLRLRGQQLVVPPPRMLLVQIALSSFSWLCMAATLHVLLPAGVGGVETMGMLFFSSIAGALLHVPGGLGVLEGSLALLLGPRLGIAEVVAAAVAFRCVYYFLPLLAAAALYAVTEWRLAPCKMQAAAARVGRDAGVAGTGRARCGSASTVDAMPMPRSPALDGRVSQRSTP